MEEFPNPSSSYLKAKDFQDNEKTVTFLGWERKPNEDLIKDGKVIMSWKDRLDYMLKYSFPEFAKDKAGEQIMGEDGQPMRNSNYLPQFPKGYSIVYKFNIGNLESGSMPLFNAFCRVKPKPGEKLVIMRSGEKTDTEWYVVRAKDRHTEDVPAIDVDEVEIGGEKFKRADLKPDADVPF